MRFISVLSVLLAYFTPIVISANNTTIPAAVYSTFVYKSSESSTANNSLVWSINAVESTGDIFFHLQAPASGSWVSVGFGSQMQGTLMIVAYPANNGKDITISPRIASGRTEPSYTTAKTVDKSSDQGLVKPNTVDWDAGIMYIDGVCRNCTTWDDKKLDLKNKAAQFIFAVGPGLDIDADALDAPLSKHVFHGSFTMDMTAATSTNNGSVPQPVNGTYTTRAAMASGDAYTAKDSGLGPPAHAALMLFAWVILFPMGSIILRMLNSVVLHMVVQGVGVLFILISFGIAISLGGQYNRTKNFQSGHQILGLFLILGLLLQLGLGIVGHRIFKRTNVPWKLSRIHFILGPVLIILAIVNGGLGLQLANLNFLYTRYAVIIIGIAVLFIPFRVVAHVCVKRRKARQADLRVAALGSEQGGYQYPQFGAAKEPYTQAVPLQTYSTNEPMPQYHGPPQYR